MKSANFFAELKRRNVYNVAVAYAIVGWLSIQIATQVFPFLEIPNWVVRLVIVAVAIGFPIALVIAWAFELTPAGLKRTEDVDASGELVPKKHAASSGNRWCVSKTVNTNHTHAFVHFLNRRKLAGREREVTLLIIQFKDCRIEHASGIGVRFSRGDFAVVVGINQRNHI